jgi:hypothetical protein
MKYTKGDVAKTFSQVFEEIMKLREAGQQEYAHGDDSPFRNFEALAVELDLPREKVLWTYAMKHRDGIVAWLNGHKSQREGVNGRINDLIVYLILLRAMIDEDNSEIMSPTEAERHAAAIRADAERGGRARPLYG